MTVPELAQECQRRLDAGLKYIPIVLSRQPKGARMRLFGRVGPLGEVTCVNSDNRTVCHFEILDVLAYLAAAGLVEVRTRGESQAPKT